MAYAYVGLYLGALTLEGTGRRERRKRPNGYVASSSSSSSLLLLPSFLPFFLPSILLLVLHALRGFWKFGPQGEGGMVSPSTGINEFPGCQRR
jgi:hypothetical protein